MKENKDKVIPVQYLNLDSVNSYLENSLNVKPFPTVKLNVTEEDQLS